LARCRAPGAGGTATVAAEMSPPRAIAWALLFALLGLTGGGLVSCEQAAQRSERPAASRVGTVTEIVDGDTIHVRLGGRREKVRYIGVDTPESRKPNTPVQCFAKAATAANARLVAGRRVRLRTDVETRDRYGRLLAYVYRLPDGLFVNAELVRRGFATVLTIPPNVAHADEFLRLQRQARAAGRGLWRACAESD
jgi:micrococcal nuclease